MKKEESLVLNNMTRAHLARQELANEAQRRGIQVSTPISRRLADGERRAFENQLAQVRSLLAADMNSREFIDSAISHNQAPESYHEYLVKRENVLAEQLSAGVFYYNLPTNEFVDYIADNYAVLQSSTASLHQKIQDKSTYLKIAAVCACCFAVLTGVFAYKAYSSANSPVTPPSIVQNDPQTNTDAASDTFNNTKPTTQTPPSEEQQMQPLPYPDNGTILVNAGLDLVAPLTVQTEAGLAYYIKLCDMSGNEVLGFFAGPNATVKVSAPLGTYELRYACGTAWYGTTPKFGKNTSYFKADTLFEFTEDTEYTHGYTVTLYAVPDGNMDTQEIDASEF